MKRLSLRLRLAIAGAVAVILALGLAAAGLTTLFGTHVERRATAELSVQLDQVLAGLGQQDGNLTVTPPPADPRFQQPYGGLYWQVETNGQVLRSRSLWDYELSLPSTDQPDHQPHSLRLTGPDDTQLLVFERRVTLPERLGNQPVRVAVAMDAGQLESAQRAFMTDLAPFLALLALFLIAAQAVQLLVGLRPLRWLGTRIAALRSGQATRMGTDWPQEVQPLADELDALLEKREADISKARARAGDLAHGLKTPLQALLGEAGRLRTSGSPRAAEDIEEVARAMQRHVDRELLRARAAARAREARADVAETTRGIISVLKRSPDGAGVAWSLDIAPTLHARIDSSDLAEALGALAENAARHASSRVNLSGRALDDRIEITIRDDGPGIPPAQIETLTTRGRRLDESARSNGFGLAIASEIADAAGGSLVLENRAQGLEARLELPRA
ncbi:sensor histidine kinase [Fodinicurvata fenggangensis]|uniref:sensor histidine kinase n=1 Tax=Fodinicurvata fenggangensis TaxID=1121830 RepID=UPI00047C0D0F|nr:HAMP domain-containing sensor histidine kinase [Fodinicurvata fenggangensis]